jgi:hypothetical protein
MTGIMNYQSERALYKIKSIEKLLQRGDFSLIEIETELNSPKNGLQLYVVRLKELGLIHVCAYRVNSNRCSAKKYATKVKIYRLGAGVDVERNPGVIKKPKLAKQVKPIDTSGEDRIIIKRHISEVNLFRNTDPLMQAFYGI